MAITQTDIDALKAAIAKGLLEAELNGERVKFDSYANMRARLRWMEDELAGASSGQFFTTYPRTGRGL